MRVSELANELGKTSKEVLDIIKQKDSSASLFALKVLSGNSCVTVHGLSMPAHCNRILPMLRIPNRQNPRS